MQQQERLAFRSVPPQADKIQDSLLHDYASVTDRATICNKAQTDGIAAAMRQLSDDDLVRLRAAANSSLDGVPGLLAYLDYAADWEQHRRRGVDLEMRGPMAALDDSDVGTAIAALGVLAVRFRATGNDAVASLFDAIAQSIGPAVPSDSGHSLH